LRLWPSIVGEAIALHTSPRDLHQGCLRVATSSSVWAQTLTFERLRILEKLNLHLTPPLKELQFATVGWQKNQSPSRNSQDQQDWQHHPSRLPKHFHFPRHLRTTPEAAFQAWAEQMQGRSVHFPPCPRCHCPSPPGELQRWQVCALCWANQSS
jgi:predicted nucleic acid-binding Zn ribbon protein